MSYEDTIAIRNNIAITENAWTDIGGEALGAFPIPISCNQIVVVNTSLVAILLATDPNNSYSTVEIPSGSSWALGTPSWGPRLGGPASGARFWMESLDAACSLQSTDGDVTISLEFIL